MMATAQCGVVLEVLEDAVRLQGLTTGHSPQSKPLAQMGGLTGHAFDRTILDTLRRNRGHGRGSRGRLPRRHDLSDQERPSQGGRPDIRQVIVGSEGSLCFITEVTVKLYRYRPENNVHRGFLVDDIDAGIAVVREVVTDGFRPSVCRVVLRRGRSPVLFRLRQGQVRPHFYLRGSSGHRCGHRRQDRQRDRRLSP